MDIKNTIISAKVVIESLVALLENEDVDISSIKFKVGSQEEGYESEDMSFESLINLTMKGLKEAKAQAVPEGFVLVPEDQAKDTDRLNFLLGGEKYIRTVTHRDIQNDEYEKIGEHFQLTEVFWIDGFDYWENTSSNSERGAIDKAMIEAREQKG